MSRPAASHGSSSNSINSSINSSQKQAAPTSGGSSGQSRFKAATVVRAGTSVGAGVGLGMSASAGIRDADGQDTSPSRGQPQKPPAQNASGEKQQHAHAAATTPKSTAAASAPALGARKTTPAAASSSPSSSVANTSSANTSSATKGRAVVAASVAEQPTPTAPATPLESPAITATVAPTTTGGDTAPCQASSTGPATSTSNTAASTATPTGPSLSGNSNPATPTPTSASNNNPPNLASEVEELQRNLKTIWDSYNSLLLYVHGLYKTIGEQGESIDVNAAAIRALQSGAASGTPFASSPAVATQVPELVSSSTTLSGHADVDVSSAESSASCAGQGLDVEMTAIDQRTERQAVAQPAVGPKSAQPKTSNASGMRGQPPANKRPTPSKRSGVAHGGVSETESHASASTARSGDATVRPAKRSSAAAGRTAGAKRMSLDHGQLPTDAPTDRLDHQPSPSKSSRSAVAEAATPAIAAIPAAAPQPTQPPLVPDPIPSFSQQAGSAAAGQQMLPTPFPPGYMAAQHQMMAMASLTPQQQQYMMFQHQMMARQFMQQQQMLQKQGARALLAQQQQGKAAGDAMLAGNSQSLAIATAANAHATVGGPLTAKDPAPAPQPLQQLPQPQPQPQPSQHTRRDPYPLVRHQVQFLRSLRPQDFTPKRQSLPSPPSHSLVVNLAHIPGLQPMLAHSRVLLDQNIGSLNEMQKTDLEYVLSTAGLGNVCDFAPAVIVAGDTLSEPAFSTLELIVGKLGPVAPGSASYRGTAVDSKVLQQIRDGPAGEVWEKILGHGKKWCEAFILYWFSIDYVKAMTVKQFLIVYAMLVSHMASYCLRRIDVTPYVQRPVEPAAMPATSYQQLQMQLQQQQQQLQQQLPPPLLQQQTPDAQAAQNGGRKKKATSKAASKRGNTLVSAQAQPGAAPLPAQPALPATAPAPPPPSTHQPVPAAQTQQPIADDPQLLLQSVAAAETKLGLAMNLTAGDATPVASLTKPQRLDLQNRVMHVNPLLMAHVANGVAVVVPEPPPMVQGWLFRIKGRMYPMATREWEGEMTEEESHIQQQELRLLRALGVQQYTRDQCLAALTAWLDEQTIVTHWTVWDLVIGFARLTALVYSAALEFLGYMARIESGQPDLAVLPSPRNETLALASDMAAIPPYGMPQPQPQPTTDGQQTRLQGPAVFGSTPNAGLVVAGTHFGEPSFGSTATDQSLGHQAIHPFGTSSQLYNTQASSHSADMPADQDRWMLGQTPSAVVHTDGPVTAARTNPGRQVADRTGDGRTPHSDAQSAVDLGDLMCPDDERDVRQFQELQRYLVS
ncbi:hypothetical protein BC831DRAFT_447375 [Entophlyctis helioformis]|nr:hypothetical protein BC831DRAFT_447375 [Entophlyctis helioformis]